MEHTLQRTTFETSRELEYFTIDELTKQINFKPDLWGLALTKELIDNCLDACESHSILPEITVVVDNETDSVTVQDNGPGLPISVVEKSLDYSIRVSDKAKYISPTRGQLGNALKCIWAAPVVLDGAGHSEVATGGNLYHVDIAIDQITEKVRASCICKGNGFVKTGTFVKMTWPGLTSQISTQGNYSFYKKADIENIWELLNLYAAFNPHTTFHLSANGKQEGFSRTHTDWIKWLTKNPTSPHWYSVEQLRTLIAAYIKNDLLNEKRRTIREFVSEFRGLKGTASQRKVTTLARLDAKYLDELVEGDTISKRDVWTILKAMQKISKKKVNPKDLGIIGKEHMAKCMVANHCVDPESIEYKKIVGSVKQETEEGVIEGRPSFERPFVVEVAIGWLRQDLFACGGEWLVGINFTPMLNMPIPVLHDLF